MRENEESTPYTEIVKRKLLEFEFQPEHLVNLRNPTVIVKLPLSYLVH